MILTAGNALFMYISHFHLFIYSFENNPTQPFLGSKWPQYWDNIWAKNDLNLHSRPIYPKFMVSGLKNNPNTHTTIIHLVIFEK